MPITLEQLKAKGLNRDDLVEVRLEEDHTTECTTSIRPMYFVELTADQIPAPRNEGCPTPPFISIAPYKDKNGCWREIQDHTLDNIRYLEKWGKSKFSAVA